MANVPTNEVEHEYSEPVSMANIREAILAVMPEDENIQRDVRLHDGIADIGLKWRTLRWNTCMAYQTMTPDMIAAKVGDEFRDWIVKSLNNGNDRHGRVLADIARWLRGNKNGIWVDVYSVSDGGQTKWLIRDKEPAAGNKASMEAAA